MFRIILLFLFLSRTFYGQNCTTNFKYHRAISLSLSGDNTLSDQSVVAIPLNTKILFDSGKLKMDGSDFRVFDDNCQALPFFIQGISERENNVLYVKVPAISGTPTTIHLYYGSESIQVSRINGAETFLFFDDFEDGNIDLDRWEVVGQYDLLEESNGKLRFTGHYGDGGIFQYITPRLGYSDPVTFDFSANANNSQIYGIADTSDIQRIALRYNTGLQTYDTLDIIALMYDTINGGTNPGISYPMVKVTRRDLNIISLSAFIDDGNKLNFTRFINHSSQDQNLDTLNTTQMDFKAMRPFFASFGSPVEVEFVGIRAALPHLPLIEKTDEENLSVTSLINEKSHSGINIYPVPAHNKLHVLVMGQQPHHVTIIDLAGKTCLDQSFHTDIDIGKLKSGYYLIKVFFPEGGSKTQLFTIIHR